MSIRNYSNTAAQSTLIGSIGATDTSITLAGYAGDPTPPFTAALARGTASEEIVLVTAVIGSTVTVTRGYDGTSAQAQAAGATFQEVVVALDFREANNHVNSGASGAHGTTSQLVGVSDVQTLTNKTLTAPQVSNLTGTGTTTLAATTVTTLTATGATSLTSLTVSGALTANGGVSVPAGVKVALADAPAGATDAANKNYVDGKTWPTTALSDAASAATPSVAVKRDGSGRAQVADPAVAADIATKNYVDGRAATLALARLRQTTAQTGLAAGWADVTMGVADIDSASGWSASPTPARWTVPAGQGGTYALAGIVSFAGISSGLLLAVRIAKNTATIPGAEQKLAQPAGQTTAQFGAGRHVVTLAAGDYVYLQGYCSGGGWSTASPGGSGDEGTGTSFTIERIR